MNYQRAFKYAAIGAAVLIPTLVIAQQQAQPPGANVFVANQVLRAGDVEQMRLALVSAIARLNALESNAGGALTKENMSVYDVEGDSGPIAVNVDALAQARCRDTSDVLIDCSCEGRLNTTNQLSFQLRRVRTTNPVDGVSTCTCQAVNVGNEGRSLFAIAQCVTVP
jgi:signal recognition particle GTPase